LININRKKIEKKKRDLIFESESRHKRRKGKEEDEKREKDEGRRRELEKISLKCKIYALMYINIFSLVLIFCFVKH
jgi:hypothetical protein